MRAPACPSARPHRRKRRESVDPIGELIATSLTAPRVRRYYLDVRMITMNYAPGGEMPVGGFGKGETRDPDRTLALRIC